MKRKIAMVGTAASGIAAPYADPSWEIWGVSQRAEYVTRATRWFELHRLDGEPQDWANLWRKSLSGFIGDTELIMMYPEPGLAKNLTVYPHEQIVARFGTFFMTSTFAWMMALALNELRPIGGQPVDGEIAIYGVDMEYGTEYRQQRSGFRHFIQLAAHMGVPVTRLADGGLAYEPVPYPMWQDDPLLSKLTLRSKIVKERLASFNESLAVTQEMMAQARAKLDLLEELKRCVVADADSDFSCFIKNKEEQLERDLQAFTKTSATISKDIVKLEGNDDEQQWMIDYLQP